MKHSREYARIHRERDFRRIPIGLWATYWTHTYVHAFVHAFNACTHTCTYAWSVIRAYGPQGRAMLHRELHYVYAHSSHCAPFSGTLSFYLSLGPSLSLSLSFFLRRVYSFLSSNLFLTLIFFYISSYVILHFRCSFSLRLLVPLWPFFAIL